MVDYGRPGPLPQACRLVLKAKSSHGRSDRHGSRGAPDLSVCRLGRRSRQVPRIHQRAAKRRDRLARDPFRFPRHRGQDLLGSPHNRLAPRGRAQAEGRDRGVSAGPPRRAHRPSQPPLVHRGFRQMVVRSAGRRLAHCSSSTSTISSRSTTSTATGSATRCSGSSPSVSRGLLKGALWRGSGATSLASSCATASAAMSQSAWRGASSTKHQSRYRLPPCRSRLA